MPDTEVAVGFTYRYVKGVEGEPGENPLELEVEVEDRPKLVAFASSEEGSPLTLSSPDGHETMGAPSGDFASYMLLESSGDHRLRLRQDGLGDGTLAVAVYDLVDTPPDGVTDGVRTFRQEVPGYELVDAVIGERGQTDLTTTVVLPEGPLRWDDLCIDGGKGLMARVKVVGQRGWWGTGCEGGEQRGYDDPDASFGGSQSIDEDTTPRGVPVDIRVWLGKSDGGANAPAVEDPDALLGVAVYNETGDRVRVLGEDLHEVEEWFGHTWRIADVHEGTRGAKRFDMTLPASEDMRIVNFVVTGLSEETHRLHGGVRGSEESGWFSNVGGTTSNHGPFVVLPGKEHVLRLRVPLGHTPQTTVAAVISERAD